MPTRTSSSPAATRATYSREPPTTVRHCGRAGDREHPVVGEELEQVARRVVERDRRVARPDRGDERLHELPAEVRREAAVGEEVPQGLVVGRALRLVEQRARPGGGSAGPRASIRRNAGRRRLRRGRGTARAAPSAPAYSRPVASSRTDIDISDGWVATPTSAKSRSSVG